MEDTARRYVMIIQDPMGDPAPSEQLPPKPDIPRTAYAVVKADDYEALLKKCNDLEILVENLRLNQPSTDPEGLRSARPAEVGDRSKGKWVHTPPPGAKCDCDTGAPYGTKCPYHDAYTWMTDPPTEVLPSGVQLDIHEWTPEETPKSGVIMDRWVVGKNPPDFWEHDPRRKLMVLPDDPSEEEQPKKDVWEILICPECKRAIPTIGMFNAIKRCTGTLLSGYHEPKSFERVMVVPLTED